MREKSVQENQVASEKKYSQNFVENPDLLHCYLQH